MFNPIVFKRLNKSWMAEILIPELKKTYENLEGFLGIKILNFIDIVRIFAHIEQQNDWLVKSQQEGFSKYLTDEKTTTLAKNNIDASHGYGLLKGGGWVDLVQLLSCYRDYLRDQNLILEESYLPELVIKRSETNSYNGIETGGIIYCEGSLVKHNPYFKELPFTLTKGEVLSIKSPGLKTEKILNRGFFILPQKDQNFRVGATYNWADKDTLPTQSGKEVLEGKLKNVWKGDYHILEHKAGLRPTTKDRRPIIGEHPEYKGIYIFNGLGTKGVMIAPYFVKHFCDYLLNGNELNKEVDLNRFMSS